MNVVLIITVSSGISPILTWNCSSLVGNKRGGSLVKCPMSISFPWANKNRQAKDISMLVPSTTTLIPSELEDCTTIHRKYCVLVLYWALAIEIMIILMEFWQQFLWHDSTVYSRDSKSHGQEFILPHSYSTYVDLWKYLRSDMPT